ncbi:hypothetical protein CKO31_11390 [Thiohalocapsa halophila]|uniref:Uncharacterized protein n=1 Tax=Thiohalocapsa halophila TaxID=69359 RepID=A0ABS1CIZ7_9GAMM|nr:hypothetical protein [Thiohalocapsa halophila]MBK1631331.1 hypothetical protein [Thiohalocapsa halophila]
MPIAAKLLPLLLIAVVAAATVRAGDIRTERVHFAPGATGAVIAGSIQGRGSIDYLLGARAGQTLSVTMDSDNTAAYFNVIPPDAENVAVYAGHTGPELNRYVGTLDLDGDWKLRVYLYRAAARRGETADYRLQVEVAGEPDPGTAREANDFGPREWDARGDLGCARGGRPMQAAACPFKVVRYRMDEGATVFVIRPGADVAPGAARTLYLHNGEWSTPASDAVSASQHGDLWTVTVGEEVYEIPAAVISGG